MVSTSAYVLIFCALSATTMAQSPSNAPVSEARLDKTADTTTQTAAKPPDPSKLTPEMRGDILMARKMYREAAETYMEGPPNNHVLENKIGIAYHQMLAFDIAKKHYEKSIQLKSDYAEAINNLGTVFYAQKKFRRAVGQYKKALKHSPNSASIYSNLGTAEFSRKRYKEAFESYQKALSLDPEVFERRSTQGVLLQERSVEERAKFHYYLAKTYAKAGDDQHALMYIRKALEEGFKEKNKFREEPEFAKLQENPEFEQLMTLEPRVL